jgi:hypothetical protein
LTGRWRFTSGEALALAANLSDRPRTRPAPAKNETFWGSAAEELAPFAVHAAIEAA